MAPLTNTLDGIIAPRGQMEGVYPGAGVARGGQQGRPRALTGGIVGVKSPIPNAKGSLPRPPAPGIGNPPSSPAPAAPQGAPAQVPNDAPRPATAGPGAQPIYGWWRANAMSPWQRYVKAWSDGGQG